MLTSIFSQEDLIEQIEMEIDDAGMDNDFDDGGRWPFKFIIRNLFIQFQVFQTE